MSCKILRNIKGTLSREWSSFYHMRCCFTTVDRELVIYFYNPLSMRSNFSKCLPYFLSTDWPDIALTRTPFWNASLSVSCLCYATSRFPSLRLYFAIVLLFLLISLPSTVSHMAHGKEILVLYILYCTWGDGSGGGGGEGGGGGHRVSSPRGALPCTVRPA